MIEVAAHLIAAGVSEPEIALLLAAAGHRGGGDARPRVAAAGRFDAASVRRIGQPGARAARRAGRGAQAGARRAARGRSRAARRLRGLRGSRQPTDHPGM